MIEIRSVTKRFGRTVAVDGATLAIRAGDAVALWGSNGAGKSTLIRCVLGLLRFRGTIEIAGLDVLRRGKHARRLVGYVPQELGFYDELGVSEAVRHFAALKGVCVRSPAEVLRSVGLEGHERKRVRELSGGMKQRLALSIALLGDPPALILDEVTASLDAGGRAEFVALLRSLAGAGRTLLFASHRVEEVTALADRVVLLEGGRIAGERSAEHFAAAMVAPRLLHLSLAPSDRGVAMDLLRAEGFAPRANGVGLLVPVERHRKAAPLRILTEGRIRIEDFDIVDEPTADPEDAP